MSKDKEVKFVYLLMGREPGNTTGNGFVISAYSSMDSATRGGNKMKVKEASYPTPTQNTDGQYTW